MHGSTGIQLSDLVMDALGPDRPGQCPRWWNSTTGSRTSSACAPCELLACERRRRFTAPPLLNLRPYRGHSSWVGGCRFSWSRGPGRYLTAHLFRDRAESHLRLNFPVTDLTDGADTHGRDIHRVFLPELAEEQCSMYKFCPLDPGRRYRFIIGFYRHLLPANWDMVDGFRHAEVKRSTGGQRNFNELRKI